MEVEGCDKEGILEGLSSSTVPSNSFQPWEACKPMQSTSHHWGSEASTEPPQNLTIVQNRSIMLGSPSTFASICFPEFDAAKLQPIDLSISLPVTRLTLNDSPFQDHIKDSGKSYASSRFHSREVVPSFCRHQLREARKQALSRIGLPTFPSETNLLSAVRRGDLVTVKMLLKKSVNPNATDWKKRTGLHIATAAGHIPIMCVLLQRRADANRQDSLGNTPLHLAACRGNLCLVELLLNWGSNVHIKDNKGQTALSIVMLRMKYCKSDRSISVDKLKSENEMIADLIRKRSSCPDVEALCSKINSFSTREPEDIVMDKMADLDIAQETRPWS